MLLHLLLVLVLALNLIPTKSINNKTTHTEPKRHNASKRARAT